MLATLFVGSSRGPKSTSHTLGTYLLERLEARGINTDKIFILPSLSSEQGIRNLLKAAAESDIIILAAPLFADSLPSPVVKTFELICEDVSKKADRKRRSMIAISNCGFPEARHSSTSLAISRRFALACGFHWAGGLALGGGGAIGRKPLAEAGGFAKNVRKSLSLTAEALAKGADIPEEAVNLMSKPLMPNWLYLQFSANPLLVWYRLKKHGVKESAWSRPYRE